MLGKECPKCAARMEPGFCADLLEGHEARQVAWHPGLPRADRIVYLGIEVSQCWEVRVDPELLEPVTQYRCSGCGYLEAYAH